MFSNKNLNVSEWREAAMSLVVVLRRHFLCLSCSVSLNLNANINSLKACSERLVPLLKEHTV